MSEEQLKAFIAKVQADISLQEKLEAEGADPVAIAKAAGFAITEAEVKAYQELQTRDLSDEELDGVAGGYLDGIWVMAYTGSNPNSRRRGRIKTGELNFTGTEEIDA